MWHRDGHYVETETTVTSLLDDPDIRGVVLTTRDVSERQALQEQLTRQAYSDQLTGLANRTLFRERIEAAVDDSTPSGVAVLFLDLDGFKGVNDAQGHATGDHLLALVGQRLRNAVRPGDVVARLGGDEFGVLVTGEDAEKAAVWVAHRVRRVLANDFRLEGHEITVGASIGIAVNQGGDESADQLLRNADLAMYRAKSQQRQAFVVFEAQMHDAAVARDGGRGRPAAGGRPRRARPALPADRRPAHAARRRGRGAAALAAPGAWPARPVGVHRRWPRRPGWSRRSGPGRSTRAAGRPRAGSRTAPPAGASTWRSTCRPASSTRGCRAGCATPW